MIAVSILGMVWTSSGAVGVIARCLSRLLDRSGAGIVIGKLRNLGVAAALATLIVLMVLGASAGTGVARRLGVSAVLVRVAVPLASTGVAVLICTTVYRVLASGSLRRRSALAGGAAGLSPEATPTVAGYYLRYVAGRSPSSCFWCSLGC